MRVLLNAISAKMGGAANYARNMAVELARVAPEDEFIIILPANQARAIERTGPNIRIIPVPNVGLLKRLWFDQITLRRMLRRERVDVLYSTANLGIFWCPVPQVLLVRNSLYFSPLFLRHTLSRMSVRARLTNALRRWLVCRSVEWAEIVVTPSESMMQDLRAFVDQPSSKFHVIPYGTILERFQGEGSCATEQQNGTVRLLHISHYADHKNVGVLFESLEELRAIGITNVALSTTADVEDTRYLVSFCRVSDRALLSRPSISECVQLLGDVPYEQVAKVYQGHDIFVFPSLAESYGHPLVEAMASGLPVVAANLAYARELCGDAAMYFDPFSAYDLAQQISRLVADPLLRKKLGQRGWSRVRQMDWSLHVRRLVHLFRESVPEHLPRHGEEP
jgi:glycosyltransferase involved in cell wall biosynthesis